MVQILGAERVPLEIDAGGSIRVGNTRVMLDLVISAHNAGMSPEQIVEAYSTLELADVYDVIAYYLRHRSEIDAYIEQRQLDAGELREDVEANQDLSWIRNRVQAHRTQLKAGDNKPAG